MEEPNHTLILSQQIVILTNVDSVKKKIIILKDKIMLEFDLIYYADNNTDIFSMFTFGTLLIFKSENIFNGKAHSIIATTTGYR